MDNFEKIDKIVKCKKFKDAFLFDEILSKVFGVKNFGIAAIRLWILDHRYGALVNVRLYQMVMWKQLLNLKKLFEKMGIEKKAAKLSKTRKLRLVIGIPSVWKYLCLYIVYKYLSVFFARLLMSLHMNLTISPFADIGKGFWGAMKNLGITAGTKVGKNVNIAANVTIVPSNKGVPVIEDNVKIWVGATIMGSLRIGKGAVVGANSLVISNVEPGYTVVGVPASAVFRKKVSVT